MNVNHYIGFDVHKKTVSYCVKTDGGMIVEELRPRACPSRRRRGCDSPGARGRGRIGR